MGKVHFFKLVFYFFLLLCNVSCDGVFNDEGKNFRSIKKYLKAPLPSGVTSFNSTNECLDKSFKRPCIFFSSFSISKDDFANWINEIKIPEVDSSFFTNNCNNDQQVLNKLTSLQLRDFAEAQKRKWWNPTQCDYHILYASFYNSQAKKIIHSYSDSWDGRALILYCPGKSLCHLLIETFL